MIPIRDDNPTFRRPVVDHRAPRGRRGVWHFVQGAGLDAVTLAASVCDWGWSSAS